MKEFFKCLVKRNKKITNILNTYMMTKTRPLSKEKTIFFCKNRTCDLWFSNAVLYPLGQYDLRVMFSSILIKYGSYLLFNPVLGFLSETFFSNFNLLSVEIKKKNEMLKSTNKWRNIFKNKSMKKEKRAPPPKKNTNHVL